MTWSSSRLRWYLIGVDHIQDVIDSLGYAWADQALLEVVNQLVKKLKPDQYSVVLKVRLVLVSLENDVSNITQIADELRNVVKPIMIDDKPFLTLSIGISYDEVKPRFPFLHCSQCNGFYSQNGVTAGSSSGMNEMVKTFGFSAALKEAIITNLTGYQPQIFAETGELYGIEALFPWYDPRMVMCPFTVYSRRRDCEIENIGRWVIELAVIGRMA